MIKRFIWIWELLGLLWTDFFLRLILASLREQQFLFFIIPLIVCSSIMCYWNYIYRQLLKIQ